MSDTVHVIVGWNDDYERPYIYKGNRDEADSESRMWGFDVDAALWHAYERTSDEANAAFDALMATIPFEDGKLTKCCSQWRGDISPAQRWWVVGLASVGEDEWPSRDTTFGPLHKSEAEAQAYIDELPDSFYAINSVCPPVLITKSDRLSITEQGHGEYASSCYDCGWDRGAHKPIGLPGESQGIIERPFA